MKKSKVVPIGEAYVAMCAVLACEDMLDMRKIVEKAIEFAYVANLPYGPDRIDRFFIQCSDDPEFQVEVVRDYVLRREMRVSIGNAAGGFQLPTLLGSIDDNQFVPMTSDQVGELIAILRENGWEVTGNTNLYYHYGKLT